MSSGFVYYEACVVVEVKDGRALVPSLQINGDATPSIILNEPSAPGGLIEIDDQHPEWDNYFDTALSMVPNDSYDLTAIFGGLVPGDGYPAYHMDDPRSHG